jgi:hypothetical protein
MPDRLLHDALQIIQKLASDHSVARADTDEVETARTDFFLSTDHLVNMATVIFLVANPKPVKTLAHEFDAYVLAFEMIP